MKSDWLKKKKKLTFSKFYFYLFFFHWRLCLNFPLHSLFMLPHLPFQLFFSSLIIILPSLLRTHSIFKQNSSNIIKTIVCVCWGGVFLKRRFQPCNSELLYFTQLPVFAFEQHWNVTKLYWTEVFSKHSIVSVYFSRGLSVFQLFIAFS